MPARWPLAIAPVLWNNDDLPELAPPVPLERVLDETAGAGYEGTELASNAPLESAVESRTRFQEIAGY